MWAVGPLPPWRIGQVVGTALRYVWIDARRILWRDEAAKLLQTQSHFDLGHAGGQQTTELLLDLAYPAFHRVPGYAPRRSRGGCVALGREVGANCLAQHWVAFAWIVQRRQVDVHERPCQGLVAQSLVLLGLLGSVAYSLRRARGTAAPRPGLGGLPTPKPS